METYTTPEAREILEKSLPKGFNINKEIVVATFDHVDPKCKIKDAFQPDCWSKKPEFQAVIERMNTEFSAELSSQFSSKVFVVTKRVYVVTYKLFIWRKRRGRHTDVP